MIINFFFSELSNQYFLQLPSIIKTLSVARQINDKVKFFIVVTSGEVVGIGVEVVGSGAVVVSSGEVVGSGADGHPREERKGKQDPLKNN